MAERHEAGDQFAPRCGEIEIQESETHAPRTAAPERGERKADLGQIFDPGIATAGPGQDDRIGPAGLDDAPQPVLIAAGLVHHRDQFQPAFGEPGLQALQQRQEERLAILVVVGMRLQQEGDGMGGALAQAAPGLIRRVFQPRGGIEHPLRVSAFTPARPFKARDTVPIDRFRWLRKAADVQLLSLRFRRQAT